MQATERLIPQTRDLAFALALFVGGCSTAVGPAPDTTLGRAASPSPSVDAAVPTELPAPLITPTGSPQASGARLARVGLVTDSGGRNDGSSNQLAELGLQQATRESSVSFEVAEAKDDSDYVPALTRFAESNYDLVIGVGIQISPAVVEVARRFPGIHFALVDSILYEGSPPRLVELPNVASLVISDQKIGYVLGLAAAQALKRKFGNAETGTVCTLGIPGPFRPSELAIAGFQDAVRTNAPAVRIIAAWDDFNAPGTPEEKGRNAGARHAEQSCDVFFANAGNAGIGYMKAAEAAGRISVFMYPLNYIFYDNFVFPGGRIENSSALAMGLRPLNVAVRAVAQEAATGSFRSGIRAFAATDLLTWGPAASALTAEAKAAVATAINDLANGRIQPKLEVIVR